ncbi:capsular biosynthesis protein [Roseibium sp. CAU 1637]|uniref:Capsular biosynthesis protein n=1 Tax=Roseibium limicola TaxID=2816037 RepID=A0A939J975_9HYPH|nr:capsular biosynthesis protein [Roseibium limicola]
MRGAAETTNIETVLPVEAVSAPGSERHFLFLQGPLSPLYRQMGRRLTAAGVRVSRINLCAGDWLHWPGPRTISFRGKVSVWPEFVERFIQKNGITDLVVHGDQRIYHKAAIDVAFAVGARVFVTELGLLRSGWMTLERNGLSTLSCFPDDPQQIRAVSESVGPIDLDNRFEKSTWLELGPDVIYNLLNVVARPLFPHFQRHTIYSPVPEYLRGAWKMIRAKKRDREAAEVVARLKRLRGPLFLLPLQLEGDFQLRAHSPFDSFSEVLDTILTSFARNAPASAKLLIKSHPLDVGYENWPQVIKDISRRRGLVGRVEYIDGGRMSDLFPLASGLVTLNSTAGLEALMAGVPVKTLVPAHFDIVGMTHDGLLEDFWGAPKRPDTDLLAAYCRALAGTVQVPGSIHNKQGTRIAAENMVRRMLECSVNEPGAYVFPPPRLERARALGVPL